MSKTLVLLVALMAAFLLSGCEVHEGHRHARHRDVIVVVPEHHHGYPHHGYPRHGR